MKKVTNEPSLRDKEIAHRMSEARRLNLHPNAVKLAGQYLSVPMAGVELYSRHEEAIDLPHDDEHSSVSRDQALRQVFSDVIYFLRWGSVPSKHLNPQPDTHEENYAADEANPSREDATEAA